MKICILSMQAVHNMGSLLQSYVLKFELEKCGNQVFFIPIEEIKEDNKLMAGYVDSFNNEWQNNIGLSKLKKIDIYLLNRIRNKSQRIEQNKIYDDFREKYLYKLEEMKINADGDNKYDYCVIGSDEVFNCCAESPWGFTSQLFGNVKEAKNVITYAASCGSTVAKNVPNSARARISQAMRRLAAISVRDENSRDFVNDIIGINPEIHLDPVLIGNLDREISSSKEIRGLPSRYCVVYAYDNRIYKKEEYKAVLEFCDSHKLTPICVGMPQFWVSDYFITDPFQCLKIFMNADFVITDTFHGTIFSAKYSSRFATVVRDSNKNKLQDLINRIEVNEHQISAITVDNLEKAYKQLHDKRIFNALIEKERERSLSYLRDSLKEIS